MINLSIRHAVADYDKWRVGFDDNETMRRAAGATGVNQIYRDAENPNQITVVLEWDTVENARRFSSDPALKEAMQAAGVTSAPEVHFLSHKENSNDEISYFVEWTISDGKVAEFKSLIADAIALVKENDPGTLRFQWHLGEDNRRCLYLATFSSSKALLAHLTNVGPTLPAVMAIAPVTRFELLGTPSAAARQALDGFGAAYFPHLGGFDR